MALNWNIEQCADWKQLTEDNEWAVTNTLIWATMIIGIRKITTENYREFYLRLHASEIYDGQFLTNRGFITLDEVKRRIGLATNASTLTSKDWNARLKLWQSKQIELVDSESN